MTRYFESIISFLENVTLVFTSTEDAHRFFIGNPQPYLDRLRHLELSFCNPNDHLFLLPSSPSPTPVPGCRACGFGRQLWVDLMHAVRTQATSLRHLRVTIGDLFQDQDWDLLETFEQFGDEVEDELGAEAVDRRNSRLPGKLLVDLRVKGLRCILNGEQGKMAFEQLR